MRGYRGEDLNPAASRRIVVCGCSHTLGVGLAEEDAWPWRLRAGYAAHHGLAPEAVNLVNLAQGAASNDYIARTLLAQLPGLQADLVVALFTHRGRAERWDGDTPFGLGPWTLEQALAHPERVARRPILQAAELHFALTSDTQDRLDAWKNILLVQQTAHALSVPLLAASVERESLEDAETGESPLLAPLATLLDRDAFCPFSLLDDDVFVDVARDGSHPGPNAHARFAELLLARYVERASRKAAA